MANAIQKHTNLKGPNRHPSPDFCSKDFLNMFIALAFE